MKEMDNPGGMRPRKMRLNFELEAAETLACLAHSSGRHQDANPISPERQGSRKAEHRFSLTTTDVTASAKPSLTEADREAKRMRRMLANRESARQTIRRRQMMFEELTRKATTLALENENLKKRKEEKMKDYQSLKETNDALKKVMAEFNVPEEAEPEPEPEPTESPVSTTAATTTQLFPPPPPAPAPLSWQSLKQSSLQQLRSSQNEHPAPAAVLPISEAWRQCLLNDAGASSSSVPNPNPAGGALLYVLQLLPNPSNVGPPESSNPSQIHLCSQCGAAAAAAAASQSSTPSINRGNRGKTVSDVGDGKPHKGGGSDLDKGAPLSMPLSFVETSSASGAGKVTVGLQLQSSGEEASRGRLAKNAQKHAPVPDPVGWLAAADTPAQARKRRRELMKLKSFRLGQFSMN